MTARTWSTRRCGAAAPGAGALRRCSPGPGHQGTRIPCAWTVLRDDRNSRQSAARPRPTPAPPGRSVTARGSPWTHARRRCCQTPEQRRWQPTQAATGRIDPVGRWHDGLKVSALNAAWALREQGLREPRLRRGDSGRISPYLPNRLRPERRAASAIHSRAAASATGPDAVRRFGYRRSFHSSRPSVAACPAARAAASCRSSDLRSRP